MPAPEDFCRTWIFNAALEEAYPERAYPDGSELAIGKQFVEQGEPRFMLSWTDKDRVLHVLTGLTYTLVDSNESLFAEACEDLATGLKWTITITYHPAAADKPVTINGKVNPASGGSEGDLSGNWGAEAPPRDGDGQPS